MTLVVTGVLDIEENFAENIRLYPNPTRDWLNFSYEGDLPPNIQIQILDVIGREIYAIQFLQNEIKVSFADLPEGIYFVRVLDGNKQLLAKRVVKNK
jgi:hypothetical protein